MPSAIQAKVKLSDVLIRAKGDEISLLVADIAAAPAYARFRTIADKAEFWPGTVCPIMSQGGHSASLHVDRLRH